MKSFLSFVAVAALACTLTGCNSTNKSNNTSPGAMRDCAKCEAGNCNCMCCKDGGVRMSTMSGCCCEEGTRCCDDKANMGVVGEAKEGCSKSDCCKTKADASLGAVGEKTEGCSGAKAGASLGAVGEKKDGCCGSAAKSDASLGAVSEKTSCTKVCPVTGKAAE